ncbi:MAG: hypothetical protein ACTSRR_05390 [Candidatus Heimdallarchaeaceae archaeon]
MFSSQIPFEIDFVNEVINQIYQKDQSKVKANLILEHSNSTIFYYLIFYSDSILICEYNDEMLPHFVLREVDIKNYKGDIVDLFLILLDSKYNSHAISVIPIIESFIKKLAVMKISINNKDGFIKSRNKR